MAADVLAQRRLVVVGASDAKDNFARTVYQELRDHGYDVAAVHPTAPEVLGDAAYRSLAEVPGPIDAVIVMVHRDRAVGVVEDAIALGVSRVWLFKGAGAGSVSSEAIELCRRHGVAVVPGACPLMFLDPGHRSIASIGGSVT